MREIPLSNCEKEFILKCVAEKKRIDGRDCYDYRRMKITFGVERGCCHVELGNTRILCQVSCDVTTPKQARPSEGMLFVNLELSPMAAPQFEIGRQSNYGVEITRILERCIKESRCVDTESLCIMSGIKVWSVRVDIHVLNHDGGLIDAASVAAITALTHFRRPDVTVSGEEVTIHSLEDRDPVPLSVHHMPICVTFAFYDQGKYLLVDPNEKEERVMEGKMVIGMNKHREICTLQMAGSMMLLKDQVLRCSNIAVIKVTEITELIHKAIENDAKARSSGGKFGFAASVDPVKVTSNEKVTPPINMDSIKQELSGGTSDSNMDESDADGMSNEEMDYQDTFKSKIISKHPGIVTIGEGGKSTWDVRTQNNDADIDLEITEELLILKQQSKMRDISTRIPDYGSDNKTIDTIELSGDTDSEEECTVVLDTDDLHIGTKEKAIAQPEEIDLTAALKKHSDQLGKGKKKKSRPR